MKLICKCGNIFDFENSDGNTVEGFQFIMDEETDELIIHCGKCDKAIVLTEPEEVEN